MNQNYSKICSSFLKGLSQRTANVIERRFGLKSGKRETLETIGESYGLTRERVRQIEEEGFSKINTRIKEHEDVFQNFKKVLKSFGNLKEEKAFFNSLAGEKSQNDIFFLLTINDNFQRISEDKNLYSFWTVDKNSIISAKKIIKETINCLKRQKEPVTPEKLFSIQGKNSLKSFNGKSNKNIFQSYLEVSKEIQKSPTGLCGLRDWLEINPRGIKDRAYLVLKKEKNPLHFKKVAAGIEKLPFPSPKKVHTATVHNELIKDERFVLVGRGLYALKEWGYGSGAVKDVIIKILKESKKPLLKEQISEKVLKERFVKENTVLLNLNDKNYFSRTSDGKYTIKES